MFTFLNALFLAGIAAGIVPVIIHLLNRRRLKRIEFSDLRFIAPLNQQRTNDHDGLVGNRHRRDPARNEPRAWEDDHREQFRAGLRRVTGE